MGGANQRRVNVEWASELQTEPAFLQKAARRLWRSVRTLPADTVSISGTEQSDFVHVFGMCRIKRVAPRFIRPCPGRMDLFCVHLQAIKMEK